MNDYTVRALQDVRGTLVAELGAAVGTATAMKEQLDEVLAYTEDLRSALTQLDEDLQRASVEFPADAVTITMPMTERLH